MQYPWKELYDCVVEAHPLAPSENFYVTTTAAGPNCEFFLKIL
jgi:hypothetical protein